MTHKIDLACIIDDDKLYVKMLSRLLDIKKLCKEFLVFENGQEAFSYFKDIFEQPTKDKVPQVILLDLNMPVMDGWQFLDEFVKIKCDLEHPITLYVVSSSINQEDIERAKEFEEVSDYWVKPISLGELEEMFEKV
ncbi:response regulator [Joostella atrarenae]|uniref:Response regulator n=1 Tax=Joostella atrarenae TaxID=679257 RepID=A0ABS9J0D4_9FLAO|nr:response regulator [Joostella atrarenae]MCF8713849.1 response regulator [Joostella atrarenae]